MKIKIDTTRCAGCGLCEETLPSLFYIDGYQSAMQEDYESLLSENEILKRKLIELAETCPFQAIELQPIQSEPLQSAEQRHPKRKSKQSRKSRKSGDSDTSGKSDRSGESGFFGKFSISDKFG